MTELLEQVRRLVDQARQAGDPPPGRSTLARVTGASEYRVRLALAKLDHQPGEPGDTAGDAGEDPGARLAPAVASTPPGWPRDDDTTPLPAITGHPTSPAGRQAGEAGASRRPRPWPLVLIGMAAAVAVWSGWVGLGRLTGFGLVQPLPGIADKFQINSAIVLPISVEAYAAYALRCWLSTGRYTPRTIRFARRSAIASLVTGAGAQIAYHLMAAAGVQAAPWPITTLVSCVPVLVLGLASALAKLVTSDHQPGASPGDAGEPGGRR